MPAYATLFKSLETIYVSTGTNRDILVVHYRKYRDLLASRVNKRILSKHGLDEFPEFWGCARQLMCGKVRKSLRCWGFVLLIGSVCKQADGSKILVMVSVHENIDSPLDKCSPILNDITVRELMVWVLVMVRWHDLEA